MNRSKLITFIVLRFVAVFLFLISFLDKYVGSFLYFTTQSNFLVIVVFLALNVYDIMKLEGKFIETPKALYILKYISVVGISLTFVVFGLILAPMILFMTEYPHYVLSISSLSMHLIIPIIAIVDFIMNDYVKAPKIVSLLLPLLFPLYYLFFVIFGSFFGITYKGFFSIENEEHVPYFFLDYKKYGWIEINFEPSIPEFGVIHWLVAITIFITVVSSIFIIIKKYQYNKRKSK